jgi:hypothetical protein
MSNLFMVLPIAMIMLLGCIAGGCVAMKDMSGTKTNFDYKRMRAQMRPLAQWGNNNGDTAAYLKFYGFDSAKEI